MTGSEGERGIANYLRQIDELREEIQTLTKQKEELANHLQAERQKVARLKDANNRVAGRLDKAIAQIRALLLL